MLKTIVCDRAAFFYSKIFTLKCSESTWQRHLKHRFHPFCCVNFFPRDSSWQSHQSGFCTFSVGMNSVFMAISYSRLSNLFEYKHCIWPYLKAAWNWVKYDRPGPAYGFSISKLVKDIRKKETNKLIPSELHENRCVKFVGTFFCWVGSIIYLDSPLKYRFSYVGNWTNINKWRHRVQIVKRSLELPNINKQYRGSPKIQFCLHFNGMTMIAHYLLCEWILYNFYYSQSSKMKWNQLNSN